MYGKQFMKFVRFVAAMVGSLWALFQAKTAAALNIKKPSLMQGGGDTSQLDSSITQIVEFILYFVYAGGIITLVIGLLLCLPVVGKSDKGMAAIKGAVIVLLTAGIIHIIYGFIGGLF
jgi:hypothetical protein